MLKHKTKRLPNGNIALYYQMRRPMEKPWVIVCVGVLLAGCLLLEYIYKSTLYGLTPFTFIFCIAFMYWALYPCKHNERLEEIWLNKNVDLRLHNVLKNYNGDVYEIKRKYYHVTVGTYGKIAGKYMLILLSNGEVLEYELKHHKSTDTEEGYHELLCPCVCNDKERIKAIKGWSLAEWWNKNINTSKNRLIFCVGLFFLASIGLAAFGMWLWFTFEGKIIFAFIGYIVLYTICNLCIGKAENRILKSILYIVSLPFAILYLWVKLTHPIMIIFGSYLFTALFAFGIPALVLIGLEIAFEWDFSSTTILFVTLSIGSITCVFFSNVVQWIIKNQSPLRNWGNHKYEAVAENLSLYILDSSNINFLIYLAYLLFLAASGYMRFQNNTSLIHPEFDEAVLKAFLVFIAYSNVVKHFKDVKFDTKTFIGKIFKLI